MVCFVSTVQPIFSMILSRVVCILVVLSWLHSAHLSSVVDVEHWSSLRLPLEHDDARDWLKVKDALEKSACHICSTW